MGVPQKEAKFRLKSGFGRVDLVLKALLPTRWRFRYL